MKQGFEKDKATIWARCEKKSGMLFSPEFRVLFEQDTGYGYDEEVSLKDFRGLLEEFCKKAALISYVTSRKTTEKSVNTKRYHRCFEKRLHVVEFVIESQWRAPKTNHKLSAGPRRKRFDWRSICAEWNKVYPHDPMSSAVIKAKFYRAIAEKDLTEEYGKRLLERCAQGHEPTLARVKESLKEGLEESPESVMFLLLIMALGLYAKEAQNERTHTQKG